MENTPRDNYQGSSKAVYAVLTGAAAIGMVLGNGLYNLAPRLQPALGIVTIATGIGVLLNSLRKNRDDRLETRVERSE